MHIAFVIHNRAGTGPYFKVLEQCAALTDFGHRVTLFCTSRTHRMRELVEERDGVTVYEAPDLLWGGLRQGPDLWNCLRRCMYSQSQRFDLVHAIDCRPNVIFTALHIKYRQKIPLVLSWWDLFGGGGLVQERSSKLYAATLGHVETWFEEYFRRHADAATTITSYLAERLASMNYPTENIMVQHVGVDTQAAVPERDYARAQLGLESDVPTFCFIGTIYKTDLEMLLRALDIVKQRAAYRIIWIGNAAIPEEVCREYNIHRTGYISSEEVRLYLGASDICLLPMKVNITNKARWHSKVSDYFNAAKPVVSTPVSDFPDIFARRDVGWMSASDGAQDFAQILLQAIDERDQWEDKGRNARALVMDELDVHVLARQLLEFYGKLLPAGKTEALAS